MPDESATPQPETFHRFLDETGDTTFYGKGRKLGYAVGHGPHLALPTKANITAVAELIRYHSAMKSA